MVTNRWPGLRFYNPLCGNKQSRFRKSGYRSLAWKPLGCNKCEWMACRRIRRHALYAGSCGKRLFDHSSFIRPTNSGQTIGSHGDTELIVGRSEVPRQADFSIDRVSRSLCQSTWNTWDSDFSIEFVRRTSWTIRQMTNNRFFQCQNKLIRLEFSYG